MIDIHCHIIPNTDDGAKSEEISIEMARRAASLGYTGIFATSHYIIHDIENNRKDFLKNIDRMNRLYEKNKINLKLYDGNEIFFTNNIVGLINDKKVCTLGKSKYVLFELPLFNQIIPMNVYDEINELQNAGYKPILAHPERYDFVANDMSTIEKLIESGVLIQSNIASITGKYGKQAQKNLKVMLKRNMVHFLGTDSHNLSVYEKWDKAMKKIRKIVRDDELLNKILNNPEKVLYNKEIDFWYPKNK